MPTPTLTDEQVNQALDRLRATLIARGTATVTPTPTRAP